MSYITVSGVGGIFDFLNPKKKKKAKKKAKAKEKEFLKSLEKMDAPAQITESDPSKRGAMSAQVSASASAVPGVPDWAIYAGAGLAAVGIFMWSRR